MLTLALMRHAKSTWQVPTIVDFKRPLNDRGREAAPRMGRALKSLNLSFDAVLCSAAARTRETLDLIAPCLTPADAPTHFDDGLYLAESYEILERVHKLTPDIKTALIVGHNPGMHELACDLVHTGDAKSIVALEEKFPTAALAVFTFPFANWHEVGEATGHLEHFITPRNYA